MLRPGSVTPVLIKSQADELPYAQKHTVRETRRTLRGRFLAFLDMQGLDSHLRTAKDQLQCAVATHFDLVAAQSSKAYLRPVIVKRGAERDSETSLSPFPSSQPGVLTQSPPTEYLPQNEQY